MVAFQRDRLFASLLAVCGHRPAAIDDASALTDTVIARLRPNMASGRLSPADIIKTAQNVLQHFDTAAAVQYNAYHHL
jgi:transcriptional regulator NrdR family protein